jgi:hypothetical protein
MVTDGGVAVDDVVAGAGGVVAGDVASPAATWGSRTNRTHTANNTDGCNVLRMHWWTIAITAMTAPE